MKSISKTFAKIRARARAARLFMFFLTNDISVLSSCHCRRYRPFLSSLILPVLNHIPFFDFWCNLRSIQKELGLKSSMISLPVEHDNQGNIHGEVFIGGD